MKSKKTETSQKLNNNCPSSKEIIYFLGMGTLLAGSIIFPGFGIVAKKIYKDKQESEYKNIQKTWKQFNLKLLKRNLKRLYAQKIIEIIEENDQAVIRLTKKGRSYYLKFKLEKLSLKGSVWDRKWRLVIYDVGKIKKIQQEHFRRTLKIMNFLPLQKSVYLTPYKCTEEIEYLREYFYLSKEVMLLEVSKIENERVYKDYFRL